MANITDFFVIMRIAKKRLLFVNGHMKIGGCEKSLLDLLQHLDYDLYDVDLLLIEGKGDYYSLIPSEVKIIYRNISCSYGPFLTTLFQSIKSGRINDVWYRFVLLLSKFWGKRTLCLTFPLFNLNKQYDVAIAYRPGICADIVAYVAKARKKICWWHNGKCNYTDQQKADVDATWKSMDYIVSVSEGCKRMIVDSFTFPENRIIVIPNMIDSRLIQSMAGDFTPYSDDARIRITTVCRLISEKHLDNIIYVMLHLKENKGLKWYIIGDGAEREYLQSLVESNSLSDTVIFLGQKSNPYPYIKFADYYINTSYQESQCLSVLEAMALHKPCVVTSTIGTEGYCRDGENCLVAEQNEQSLLTNVQKIISCDACEEIVSNAFKIVVSEFSPESVVNKINNIFSYSSVSLKNNKRI